MPFYYWSIWHKQYFVARRFFLICQASSVEYLRVNSKSDWSANLKYFVKPNGNYCLRSANPSYEDIEYTDKHRIIGVMEGLIRENAPSVNEYKTLMNCGESFNDEWLDVIMEAECLGLDAKKVRSLIEIQKSMFNQLSKK